MNGSEVDLASTTYSPDQYLETRSLWIASSSTTDVPITSTFAACEGGSLSSVPRQLEHKLWCLKADGAEVEGAEGVTEEFKKARVEMRKCSSS